MPSFNTRVYSCFENVSSRGAKRCLLDDLCHLSSLRSIELVASSWFTWRFRVVSGGWGDLCTNMEINGPSYQVVAPNFLLTNHGHEFGWGRGISWTMRLAQSAHTFHVSVYRQEMQADAVVFPCMDCCSFTLWLSLGNSAMACSSFYVTGCISLLLDLQHGTQYIPPLCREL